MSYRRGRLLESVSLVTVRTGTPQVCFRQICRTGPPHHGDTERRPEAQSPSHADRRRRSPREVVLPTEAGLSGGAAHWWRDETPDAGSGDAEVEKLKVEVGAEKTFQ